MATRWRRDKPVRTGEYAILIRHDDITYVRTREYDASTGRWMLLRGEVVVAWQEVDG